ncbi:histidine phosphotransferase family protein [Frigidibacter sp.]|uniref:histidine phosphotransferase family protein n=1 Tax=Frigidibacter sp. TaxID=2586418 RepID=UPI002736919B|nr:histidine phosphotransferase family protein [Frigidibacter sp.]MDP3340124.1 histidine phosphotransferase family protein [Frigidibacter sp.]
MSHDGPDLTALLGSRICHDLISPLGAIGNGVELLAMSGTAAGPEMALIAESVASAKARIRFFRIAFGAAAPDQRLGRPEILAVIADMTRGGKLAIDWQPEGDQARREVKLAFLGLQCLESALPWGGRVTVQRQGPGWLLRAEAQRVKVDAAPWAVLAGLGDPAEVSAAQVHFALMPVEAARQARKVQADLGETGISLRF